MANSLKRVSSESVACFQVVGSRRDCRRQKPRVQRRWPDGGELFSDVENNHK